MACFDFSSFCVFDDRDWLVCGNEPGPGGEQIIIIVIVQFNWQKDPVKRFFVKLFKYDKYLQKNVFATAKMSIL